MIIQKFLSRYTTSNRSTIPKDKLKNRATQVQQLSRIQAIISCDMFISGNLFFTQQTVSLFPLNIRLDEDVFKTSWRRLSSSSSRRLDQDEYIHLSNTSSRRLQDVFKTSSRYLQDVFKTSCRNVFKTFCKNVFKTSSRRLQDAFKTSCKDISRCFQDVLLIKLFLLTSLREVLERRLSTGGFAYVTLLRHLWSEYKICKGDKNFSSFSLLLHYTFECYTF